MGGGVRGNVHARHPVSAVATAAISGPRKWERIEVFRLPTVVSSARLSLPFSSSSRRTAPVIELHTSRRRLFTRLHFQIALSRIIRTGPISMGRCADCTAGVFPLRVQKPVVSAPTGVGGFFVHVTLSRGRRQGHTTFDVSSRRFPETRQRRVERRRLIRKNITVFWREFEISQYQMFSQPIRRPSWYGKTTGYRRYKIMVVWKGKKNKSGLRLGG